MKKITLLILIAIFAVPGFETFAADLSDDIAIRRGHGHPGVRRPAVRRPAVRREIYEERRDILRDDYDYDYQEEEAFPEEQEEEDIPETTPEDVLKEKIKEGTKWW